MRLGRLEGLIKPPLPLTMYLSRIEHGFGTVNGPGLQSALERGGVSDGRVEQVIVEKRRDRYKS